MTQLSTNKTNVMKLDIEPTYKIVFIYLLMQFSGKPNHFVYTRLETIDFSDVVTLVKSMIWHNIMNSKPQLD